MRALSVVLLLGACDGAGGGDRADAATSMDAGRDGELDATTPGDAALLDAPASGDAPPRDAPAPDDAGPGTGPEHVFGVTITDPWSAAEGGALVTALDGLVRTGGRRPTVRVVFDEGVDRVFRRDGATADDYVEPVAVLAAHARIMGELLDSFFVPSYQPGELVARACEYRASLGHLVDVWEVGNEVNGEWLLRAGEPATTVVDGIVAVVDVFAADAAAFDALCPGFTLRADERAFELALTAYGNGGVTEPNCWERPEHQMTAWLAAHFGPGGRGARVRDAFDHVLVSYYEDDCDGIQPEWPGIFDEVGAIFPAARLGFGECGTERVADKPRYVQRYYAGMDSADPAFANMHVTNPRYVGGFFWWWFGDDVARPAVYDALRAALDGPFWRR